MWFLDKASKYWKGYGAVVLASLAVNLLGLAVPLFAMNVYDRVVPNSAFETLWTLGIGVGVALLFDFILRIARHSLLEYAGRNIDVQCSADLVRNVISSFGTKNFQHHPFIKQSVFEISPLRDLFSAGSITVLVDLPFCLLYVAIIFLVGGHVGYVVIGAAACLAVVSLIASIVQKFQMQSSVRNEMVRRSLGNEILDNVERIQLLGATDWIGSKWEAIASDSSRAAFRSQTVNGAVAATNQLILQGSYVATVVVGVYLISNLEMTVGALVAASMLSSRALVPMAGLFSLIVGAHRARLVMRELGEILSFAGDESSLSETPPEFFLSDRGSAGYSPPRLQLRNVSVRYDAGIDDVLSGINLNIEPGEKVGIIGPVGAGKTTLFRVLTGLMPPTDGTFLVDHKALDPATKEALSGRLAAVEQDNTLLNGRLLDNLFLGRTGVDKEELERVAALTGLGEAIRALPDGLNSDVGPSGTYLSGGQRQIVRLTRSLLFAKPLLVWDEPTSALDREVEAQFIRNVRDELTGRTLIVFSHRRPVLELVDRLVVLSGGRITMDGPKEEIVRQLSAGPGKESVQDVGKTE